MNRRAFTFGLGSIVAGFPSVCSAQSQRRPRLWGTWEKIPSVVVISPEHDPRLQAVREAVRFWNTEFSRLGSAFRFGKITHIVETVSFDDLRPFSNRSHDHLRLLFNRHTGTFDLPERFRMVDGDVIVALSDGKFNSFTTTSLAPRKNLVGIQSHLTHPLTMPNGALNVIGHEFGHVVGLDHNDDATALMCGGVAWCWPKIPSDGTLPLTSGDKAKLFEIYPPNWQPYPPIKW